MQRLFGIYRPIIVLAFLLIPVMLSCKLVKEEPISEEQQKEIARKRFLAGEKLEDILCEKDFKHALSYLDTLHAAFPRDPQFYFCEGWTYDMLEDSIRSRAAFAHAVLIYDSLIAAKQDFGDMINRAFIIQILYGQNTYQQTLDSMQQKKSTPEDSFAIKVYRKVVYKKVELFKLEHRINAKKFGELFD